MSDYIVDLPQEYLDALSDINSTLNKILDHLIGLEDKKRAAELEEVLKQERLLSAMCRNWK